jgi:acyl dehydratase
MTITTTAPAVGQELPTLTWTTGLENWNRFAAVNDEFVAIHMDDAAGQAAGYPGAFGMGNLQWSYLHNLLRAWLGQQPGGGRIRKLECSFRSPNLKDAIVSAKGRITSLQNLDGRLLAGVEVWTEDEKGRKLAPGTAVVELSTQGPAEEGKPS